jgi:hypothetical protein
MPRNIPHAETRLLRGDASRIARRHRCSVQHIVEVAAGRRIGRPALMESIRRYQERAKLAAAQQEAA